MIDTHGGRVEAVEFAATLHRAAAGLCRRGVWPDDVVAVLAPVGPERLTAVYTAMALGCVALPLELTSDLETLADVLARTDARMILVSAPLAGVALELAERSRIRQIIAFGDVPGTTPFTELLRPPDDGSSYDPEHGLFDSGVLSYAVPHGGLVTTVHSHIELLGAFHRLEERLAVTPADVVLVEPGMSEPDRVVLAAVALWNGATLVTTPLDDGPAMPGVAAAFGVTVRGGPTPRRIGGPVGSAG
ncbi:AMP-binding protein [Marinitenerispora sediminis]|uniref:AMP-binding protein n=1 Tax=Marinitenerispora sediminis TaxID=1931232 RepID=UPI001F1B4000|nr:AMP-binding protein [Marinitenerispora sediminis]